MKNLRFPGVVATLDDDALVLRSDRPLHTLGSSVVGGGFGHARWIINRHVDKDYRCDDPAADLQAFARQRGIHDPFVGLLTAVMLPNARAATLSDGELVVATALTAGVGNAASVGVSAPVVIHRAGTINIILLIDAQLTPGALVNAALVATEAKTATLLARQLRTAEGYPVTGTTTDACVVACTGRGAPLPYAGTATRLGWLIGRCVRQALDEALA